MPGRQPFSILYGKVIFEILVKEPTMTWFDDHNNDNEKPGFIFFVHEMTELLLCGMARTAEDFNTASCLQLGSVEHVTLTDY